jgi:nucleotide-binding universal stress UspA family protein
MNILVAVDLSEASDRVVESGRRMAVRTGAKLYILHVAEPEPDFVGYNAGPSVVRDQMAEQFHGEHQAVQAFSESLRQGGVDATGLLIQGPTVEVTLKEADSLNAELIIVGSHGHSAIYDVLIGSYSSGILRKAKVPVLVVPTRNPL